MFAAGTRASSKTSSLVTEALMPILCSRLPNEKPGVPFSMMKHEAPRAPLAGLVSATVV